MTLRDNRKITIILVCVLIPVGIAILTLARNLSENRKPLPKIEPIVVAPYNELIETRDGEKLIRNTQCGLTYKIPSDWSVGGLLGESKILSPEDQNENTEWFRTHQEELSQISEGDGPLGPDARSLYISCQYDVAAYLGAFSRLPYYKDFEHAEHLADAFSMGSFRAKDSNPVLLKTMKIGGFDAYELSQTSNLRDGTIRTDYSIVLERGDMVEIHLGQTEYDNLPEAVKTIIHSISFEK